MAVRTTPEKVGLICHVDSNIPLTGFIAMANDLTDAVDAADTDGDLSDSTLELIERNLAAHFYGFRDQFLQSKGEGRANASFQGQTGQGLDSSHYGRAAKLLDRTGYLANLDKQAVEGPLKASFTWAGTTYSDDQSKEHTEWRDN